MKLQGGDLMDECSGVVIVVLTLVKLSKNLFCRHAKPPRQARPRPSQEEGQRGKSRERGYSPEVGGGSATVEGTYKLELNLKKTVDSTG